MPTYNEVLNQVKSLAFTDQRRLLEELKNLVESGVEVEVSPTLRRQKIVEILEKIAATNAFGNIGDPVEWQRELRQDRPLLGRNE